MSMSYTALIISILSMLVALTSLGWNIYKEIALRARVGVSVGVGDQHFDGKSRGKLILVEVVNRGPGPVQITGTSVHSTRRFFQATDDHLYLPLPIFDHQLATRLPADLGVGQRAHIVLAYNEECFLRSNRVTVVVTDSFGRYHRPRRGSLRIARAEYEKDFGPVG
jgi:hypothetical protein